MLDRSELLAFVRRHPLAVQASVTPEGTPQAAVIGFVVNDRFELFFDTLASSRKCENLRRSPRIALVVGWELEEACTVQLEGVVDEPGAEQRAPLLALYFARFPDGLERARSPITYFRVRPTWARFSDFRGPEPRLAQFSGTQLYTP